jgi:NAD(P)-dependent dehydrogenase (short-subunit alcohol dehydrogenase family)
MSSSSQEIVVITGANTGLGLEVAKKLLREHGDRFFVFVGARSLAKGEVAAKELQNQGLKNCEALHIDVTEDDSIAQAAKVVEAKKGRVDVLHVNVCTIYDALAHILRRSLLPYGTSPLIPSSEVRQHVYLGGNSTRQRYAPGRRTN